LTALFSFTVSSGQEFSYTQYNVKDGLAGSVVYAAAEDKEGFLWFGTESGLSRFDGTHFRNFTMTDGLPDNEIIKLFVDSRNRLWIVPFRNSICYYQRGQLHNQDNDTMLHRLHISSEITSVTEDKYGNVFLTEVEAIHILGADQTVNTVKKVNGSSVAMAIGGGLNQYGLFTFFTGIHYGMYEQYTMDKQGCVLSATRSFVGRSVNHTWISPGLNVFHSENTLYFNPVSGERFTITLPSNFNSLSVLKDSFFTLNTANGAFMYNLDRREQVAHFLEGQSINASFRDSEGNFWFMSAGGGVFRIGSLGFRNYTFRDNNNLSVTCIQRIGDSLYIGTEHSCLWRSDLALQQIYLQKKDWHDHNLRRILTIVQLDKNELLLGTDGGLVKLSHLRDDSLVDYISVKSITPYKGMLLLSSMHATELFNYSDLQRLRVIWPGRSTCSYLQDSLYFVGTIKGLYSVYPGKRTLFWGEAYPIFNSRIVAMAPSPDGTLWIATSGQGLGGIRNGRLVYSFTAKDGLTSNTCRAIFISGNDIWLGTDKGVNWIHVDSGHFRITTFGKEDGLSSDAVNAIYVDKDEVYVGSAGGLTHFNVRQVGRESFCKLRITSIQAIHHTWNYDTSGLMLPHGQSSIRVDFAGISFRSTGNIIYRHRLIGLDNNWQTARETYLSYPTLPSGTYELEIVATNKFGVESNPIRVVFTVRQLLWEKAWFIFLMGTLLTGIVWVLVWWRIRHLKKINAEKISINNRMAELEQMSLKAQMNPHFIFNSLNSIQKYVMEKDILGANKFITDFSRLIRLTLEITSRSRISIDEEVRYISYYLELERVRFGNTFRYEITIAPGIDRLAYYIPPMILQPYVENSIRHGLRYREDDKGVILIRFAERGEHLICTIEDNGVGRKLASQFKSMSPIEYQSRGMTLTARRMEMMNQGRAASISIHVEDLETDDHQPAGTRIILYFPIQYVKNLTVEP
jgi:hypothetical protein